MTVFAWCKTGTIEPIQVGRHVFFSLAQHAISSWNTCGKQNRRYGRPSFLTKDYCLVEFDCTPKNTHAFGVCVKCDRILSKDESKKGNLCWRCGR